MLTCDCCRAVDDNEGRSGAEEPAVSILFGRTLPDPGASISNGTLESIEILFREFGRNGAEEPAVICSGRSILNCRSTDCA